MVKVSIALGLGLTRTLPDLFPGFSHHGFQSGGSGSELEEQKGVRAKQLVSYLLLRSALLPERCCDE